MEKPLGCNEMLVHISELVSLARELGKLEGQGLAPDDPNFFKAEAAYRTKRSNCEKLLLQYFAPKQLIHPKLKAAADGAQQALDNLRNTIGQFTEPRDLWTLEDEP